jgi:polysaccharide biosynthesis protein PslG
LKKERFSMRRNLHALTAALAAVLVLGAFASSAQALPTGFWGVVPQSSLSVEKFQRLSRGGVESVRIPIVWPAVQPTRNGEFQWGSIDVQVEAAAKAGVRVLPFVGGAPEWAVPERVVSGTGGAVSASAHLPVSGAARSGWVAFLTAVVARYGPNGSFWAEHPGVPKLPMRNWQIWNEPNFKYFIAKPNPAEYGQLVKISWSALKLADPGSHVVLAGLFAQPKGARNPRTGKHKSLNWFASDFLEAMYKKTPGVKAKFDGVGLHPYTIYASYLPTVVEEVRHVLQANHDGGKGLWVTELGWSSNKATSNNLFAKGVSGQARELRKAFTTLRNKQAKWHLQGVYWFSVDDATGACNFCDGSGLFNEAFQPKPSWTAYTQFAGGTP